VAPQSDEQRVLRAFMTDDGRLRAIPTKRKKRLVVLDLIAQSFELGATYPEPEVNAILQRYHPDFASLRRYLVDEEFLSREYGYYWRTGGTVHV
jgi:hypothetical protein